jgi:hypothetical protein
MNANRLAAATSAVFVMALLSVTAASGKPPGPAGPPSHVRCSDGASGLTAAINAANSSGGGTIKLDGHCTYQLSGVDNSDPMTGDNALPVVTSQIKIDGPGATIAGDGAARILEVSAPNGALTLNGLTLTGGFNGFAGGALFNNEAVLNVDHVVVTGNVAGAGGGIASGTGRPGPIGTTTIDHSRIDHNTAFAGGGGILNHAGILMLSHSQVSWNTAPGGGGIASGKGNPDNGGSSIVIDHSRIDHNTANGGPEGGGGGIANGGELAVDHSEIVDNTAPGGPGAGLFNHGDSATLSHTKVERNTAPNDGTDDGFGGGIANLNFGLPNTPVVTLTLDHSRVSHNSASGGGGGIFNGPFGGPATVTLDHSKVDGNTPDNCEPPGSIAGCTN